MSKHFTLWLLSMLILVCLSVHSCTKEGPEGKPGLDGRDAALTCGECHNTSEQLKAITGQYENSTHGEGLNIIQNSANCSRCHTSAGFRQYISDSTTLVVKDPTPINCRTCHLVHENYTVEDYALRTTKPHILTMGGKTYDHGNSNLCVNCHQARTVNPLPDLAGGEITITNNRYGPHYSTQANLFAGSGPIEIPGTMPYINSAHTLHVKDGCITCHMSPATGAIAGGHQMNVKYKNNSGNTTYQYTGCTTSGCHTSTSDVIAMINPNREEISILISQLEDTLVSRGLLDQNGLVPVPKTVSPLQAAAILNYKFVYSDQSHGAHNYRYTKAVLSNTIEALNQ